MKYQPHQLIMTQYFSIPSWAKKGIFSSTVFGVMLSRYQSMCDYIEWLPEDFPGIEGYMELIKLNSKPTDLIHPLKVNGTLVYKSEKYSYEEALVILQDELEYLEGQNAFQTIPDKLAIVKCAIARAHRTGVMPINVHIQSALVRCTLKDGELRTNVVRKMVRNITSTI